jgi:hypothetical protein
MRRIFLKVFSFKSLLSVSDGFQGLSKAFRYPLQLLIFTSLKLVILKMLAEPFSVIGRCSLVATSHWLHEKGPRINLPQAASGMILKNHRRLPVSIFSVKIAALGS